MTEDSVWQTVGSGEVVNVKVILEKRIRSHVLHVLETSKALIAKSGNVLYFSPDISRYLY